MVLKFPQQRLIKNLQELENFAHDLTQFLRLQPLPFFVLLTGDLGAGKTTLTQYLLRDFGVKKPVTSPTFIILNQYHAKEKTINHMDAYRLTKHEDLAMYEELFENSLNIIEWPEKLNIHWSKVPHIKIAIKQINKSTRQIEME